MLITEGPPRISKKPAHAPAPALKPIAPLPAPTLSAWEQIEAAAAAHVKAHGGTIEQATVKVLEDNPALYRQYQAEPQPPIRQVAPPAPAPQPAVWDIIDSMAKQRAAATPGLTYEQATVLVCEEYPNLYAAYTRAL